MQYIKIENTFPEIPNSAVTLGKFDGLHRGHRMLVDRILSYRTREEQAVMVAFSMADQMIFTMEERCRLVEEAGIDLLIECPLTEEFRSLTPEQFAERILSDRLHASHVVVGEDYRFGRGRAGTPDTLRDLGLSLGYQTDVIPKQMEGAEKISSSRVRRELAEGRMEIVQNLLGVPFFVEGTVIHGRGIGHRHLLPTINLVPKKEKLMPPNGVYFSVTHFEAPEGGGYRKTYRGITNVGFKPTVEGDSLGVETYLFDCEEDLYGLPCRVEFYHYRRPEYRFEGISELKAQLLSDAEAGRQYFAADGGKKDAE